MPPVPVDEVVDADTWIEDRIRRGEHVVVRAPEGHPYPWHTFHPGCDRHGCEFTGRTVVIPPVEHPMYVASIRKDGTVGPIDHAAWEDIVAFELEQQAGVAE